MTPEQLEQALAADGWPFERRDDNTWRSGFRSAGSEPFRFFLRRTANWLVLTIVPFVTVPADDAAAQRLFRRMLDLNRDLTLAKFAIDGRDVILTVELPLENLHQSQLMDGLNALVFYATTHRDEIQALAQPRS